MAAIPRKVDRHRLVAGYLSNRAAVARSDCQGPAHIFQNAEVAAGAAAAAV